MNKKTTLIILVVILVVGASGFLVRDYIRQLFFEPRDSSVEQAELNIDKEIEVVATDLDVPWEIAFLPGGEDMLVTERPGTLKRIGENEQVFEIEGVRHVGEGGLLGLALHPEFADNNQLYLYLTTETDAGLINRVERYELRDNQLSDRQVIITDIPGASFHDGGRIAFGPDGLLYITTGDAGNESLAQDTDSLAGKILRVRDDGSLPADNPFNNAVYSYGHRNPQGLAWDDEGRLWISEHGPSGAQSGFDEINLIKPGGNYGWPEVQGSETGAGFTPPVIQSGADDTWAPGDIAIVGDNLYFSGLRGQSVYKASIDGDELQNLQAYLSNEYGRIRATVVEQDYLYITTSNTDGRGQAASDDDKIIRIPLSAM